MAKAAITEQYLTDIADAIRTKTGLSTETYRPAQMAPAILTISGSGGITPTGTIDITTNGTYNVTNYASADVAVPTITINNQNKTVASAEADQTVSADSGYTGLGTVTVTGIGSSYVGTGIARKSSTDLTASGATVTAPAGYYGSAATKSVSSGTQGTPTATKGTVSNHSISVTPSVTNTAGYISGGTHAGTAVSVSAAELASGNKAITENGTGIDVVGYSTVNVNVAGSSANLGTKTIAANGTYLASNDNLDGYSSVVVDVDLDIDVDHELPSAYQQVRFITGQQSGAAIDTGIQPDETTYAMFKIKPLAVTGDVLLGTKGTNDNSDWRFFNYSQNIYWDCYSGRIFGSSNSFKNFETRKIKVQNFQVTDLDTEEVIVSGTPISSFTVPYNIFINGASATLTAQATWYYVQIYKNNTKVRDFIPCYRISDDECGLYDLVSETFFTSAGSGSFTAGPVINPPQSQEGELNLQAKTNINPTTSSQTIEPDSGYDGLSSVQINAMPSGSAVTPATTVTANPSISVNSSGLITATASATESVTPTVSAGYVSSGTAGTITVSGSNTSQLSTQAGATITPTESEQTAVASGKYTTGAVKVGAISSTYVGSGITSRNSSDLEASGATVTAPAGYYASNASKSVTTMTLPTAVSSSATSGYTSKATVSRSTSDQYINIPPGYNSAGGYYKINAVANGSATGPSSLSGSSATVTTGTNTLTLTKTGVTTTPTVSAGYVSSATASTATVALTASVNTRSSSDLTASNLTVTAPSGYYASNATKTLSDANLVAGNIKKDVTIFGTTGTYEGSGGGGSSMIVATTTKTLTSAASSISFTGLSGEPTSFVIRSSADQTTGGTKVVGVVYDGTSCFGIDLTTQAANDTGFTQSYSNGTLTVTATTASFQANEYSLVYSYGGSAANIGTADVQVGSGATSITFTGLEDEPEYFSCIFKSTFSTSSGYQRVMNVVYDGTSTYGNALDSSAKALTSWSYTYNNGSLTISSTGTNNGGYFHQPGYYQLTYAIGGDSTLQKKTVTPTDSDQTITADTAQGYTALSQVKVEGIVCENLIAGNIKSGITVKIGTDTDDDSVTSVTGTYDAGGSSKNVQVLQSTSRANSSSLTKVLGDLTVSKTGTYDIYWSGGRTNTSTSYTWGTRLYVDGSGYGTENTTWSNNCQSNHLSNVSLTVNQKLSVYSRGRSGSYYTFVPMLTIIEV